MLHSLTQVFKYSLYVSVPLVFGYYLGRLPAFWDWSERIFPSAATNPNGPYLPKAATQDRPTLHSEFSKLRLEAAVDAALKQATEEKLARQEADKTRQT